MSTLTPNYGLIVPDNTDTVAQVRADYATNLGIIDNNLGGGGGSGNVDDVEVNGVSVLNPQTHVAEITSYKEVTQAQYNALPSSKLTDGIAYFIKDGGGGSGSGGSFLLMITAETGETVTATKDGTTLTATEVSTGVYEVEVTSAGTWTISDGTNTDTVDVGIYTATLSSVPEGSTVLPTDDISTWLACGERNEGYTTLSQVLGDSVCLSALLNNNNANDYLVRSTTWASTITADSSAMSFIGLNNYCSNTLLSDTTWRTAICNSTYFESVLNVKVPAMTDATHPSGLVFFHSEESSLYAYYAFDGDEVKRYVTANYEPIADYLIGYAFPSSERIYKAEFKGGGGGTWTLGIYFGNSTSDLVSVSDTNTTIADQVSTFNYILTDNTAKTHFAMKCTASDRPYMRVSGNYGFSLYELQFYGRKDI